ncbi:hypothetical protein [Paenibacillus tuaregi]|uniref:hypothetical protein n=1 Tax=Paenibacillus tuaregi TaxID=1816681 RepID=UPI000838BD40|nr:hypothetical protein [Paenibacillus tuaregi]
MLNRILQRLFSAHREKNRELNYASSRISLTIARYKSASKQLQTEIGRSHYAHIPSPNAPQELHSDRVH